VQFKDILKEKDCGNFTKGVLFLHKCIELRGEYVE
jgi:hypothetical protein